MGDLLLDIALPRTDAGVAAQWIAIAVIWPVALVAVRNRSRDIKLFVVGLAVLNVALFALRTVH